MTQVTQKQLAKHLGISQKTVSVALGGNGRICDKTRQNILDAAAELGYRHNRIAAGLRVGRTSSAAVVWGFVNPWGADAQVGLNLLKRLQNRGLATYQTHHDSEAGTTQLCGHLDDLIGRRVDAIVLQASPSELMSSEVLERVKLLPTVAVCREMLPKFPGDLVVHDRNVAICEVVDYLVATGRRRLSFILSLEEESNPSKIRAFQDHCRSHGLDPHPHELIDLGRATDPFSQGERYEHALRREFPDQVDVDAIFAFNDTGALYVMRHLQDRGVSIPSDVAVVGFNNSEIGKLWRPPLATGDRALGPLTDRIDQLLRERLESPGREPRHVSVPMQMLWRESAGPHLD